MEKDHKTQLEKKLPEEGLDKPKTRFWSNLRQRISWLFGRNEEEESGAGEYEDDKIVLIKHNKPSGLLDSFRISFDLMAGKKLMAENHNNDLQNSMLSNAISLYSWIEKDIFPEIFNEMVDFDDIPRWLAAIINIKIISTIDFSIKGNMFYTKIKIEAILNVSSNQEVGPKIALTAARDMLTEEIGKKIPVIIKDLEDACKSIFHSDVDLKKSLLNSNTAFQPHIESVSTARKVYSFHNSSKIE